MIKSYLQFISEAKKIDVDVDKKLIDEIGKYKIFSVDGEKVRDLAEKSEEFGLSYSFKYFDFIPENEIWIENDVKNNIERKILIYSELYKIKLIDEGKGKWDAYHKAEDKEKDLRANYKSKGADKTDEKADEDIYKKEYCKLKNGEVVNVWLIDGKKVRDKYKTDFMEGGHGYVYKWIPNNEIWIEDGLHEHEIPFILLHEFVERSFMKEEKMSYDKAHDIAAKVEWSKRPNEFKKSDLDKLTEQKAIEMGNKFKK